MIPKTICCVVIVGEATDDMCTFMCITVLATCMICGLTSVSYQSSLSKELIKLFDLYLDNSIKKEKTNRS